MGDFRATWARPDGYECDRAECARARSLELDLEHISLLNLLNHYRIEIEEMRIKELPKGLRRRLRSLGIVKVAILPEIHSWCFKLTPYGRQLLDEAAQ